MPKPSPAIEKLSVPELCQIVLDSELYPVPEGLALQTARLVFNKKNPIDVEVIRLGKMCASELARRFMAQSTPRWVVIKYWRSSPDKQYRPTMRYTHYEKTRAVDQMTYFDAQLPFAKEDICYSLVETFDFCQKWKVLETISKEKPREKK